MAVGLLLACFLRDFFNFVRIQLNNRFEQHVIFDMRCDLYDKLQRLSVNYYDQRATGDLMTRVIDDVNAVERVLIDGIEQGTTAMLGLVGVTLMMISFDARLTLWSLLPIPLLMIGAAIYTTTAHRRYRSVREATSALNALLLDNLQGIRQIKGFGREPHELGRFESRAQRLRTATLRVMGAWSMYSPAMEFAAWLGYVIVFWLGGRAVIAGELSLGKLVGFLAYLGMLYQPVRSLHGLNQMFQAGRAAGERVFDILDAPVEVGEKPGAIAFEGRVRGDVEFQRVSFEYRANLPVLHEVDYSRQARRNDCAGRPDRRRQDDGGEFVAALLRRDGWTDSHRWPRYPGCRAGIAPSPDRHRVAGSVSVQRHDSREHFVWPA